MYIIIKRGIILSNYVSSFIFNGLLDPWSSVGKAVISEHIVYTVLGDCIKCNTITNFNQPYDLISNKYGTINVKSSGLYKINNYDRYRWQFSIKENQAIPDYYICVGFDSTHRYITNVWMIPGTSDVVGTYCIYIINSVIGLNRVKQFAIDSKQYDNIYQSFDILELPEFRNLNLRYSEE